MTDLLQVCVDFAVAFDRMSHDVHELAKAKGWWDQPRSVYGLLMLIASECLGEGVEAIRKPGPSEHIPDFQGIHEELADTIIRIMDMAAHLGIDLSRKMANLTFGWDAGRNLEDEELVSRDLCPFIEAYSRLTDTVDLFHFLNEPVYMPSLDYQDDLDVQATLIIRLNHCMITSGYIGDWRGANFVSNLANLALSIMAIAQLRGYPLAEAIVAKHEYNKSRPIRHGNKRY